VLETFTIPLKPLDAQMLKDFVSHWLRLQQYVENLARQLQDLELESITFAEKGFFQPHVSKDPNAMSIDELPTPDTPTPSSAVYAKQ